MATLIELAQSFNETSGRIRAIEWFQSSTGAARQAEFGKQWRDGAEWGAIDFADVFEHYENLPHQNAALNWLERTSHPRTLAEFKRLWEKEAIERREVRLNVPFFAQTDNLYEPHRTCNTSACAMVARFLGAKIAGDDEYYQIVRRYGDTTDHTAQTKALNAIGVKSTWHTNLGFSDLDKSLAAGLPIVIGILHRGTLDRPTGGHMVVVIGKNDKGYICHDPYGSLLDPGGGYTGDVRNGENVVYPRHVLNHRWLVEGGYSGWGRLFTR